MLKIVLKANELFFEKKNTLLLMSLKLNSGGDNYVFQLHNDNSLKLTEVATRDEHFDSARDLELPRHSI